MNRLLGPMEFALWLLDRHAPYNAIAIARLDGRLDEDALRRALTTMQERHPILRSRIVPDPRPRFMSDGVPAIPLRVVDDADAECWRREVAVDAHQAIPVETGPLMRAVLVRGPVADDLLLTIPHEATDGRGISFVMRDVLAALQGDAMPPLQEWPSCEELIPDDRLTAPGAAELMRSWWSRKTTDRFRAMSFDEMCAELPHVGPTIAHPWMLSEEETTALTRRCRRHECTMHGALMAALMLAVVPAPLTMKPNHSFDLRSELEPPVGDDLGVFIAPFETTHHVDPSASFWGLAQDVTNQSLARMAEGNHFDRAVGVRRSLAPNFLLDENELRHTVTLSNMGVGPIPSRYGRHTIRELYLTGSITVAVPVVSACVLDGRLQGMFNHSTSWRPESGGRDATHRMRTLLLEATDDQ